MKDIELVDLLRKNSKEATAYIYKNYYPSVKRYVLVNKGSVEDSEDLFQDVLIVLLTKIQHDNFTLSASLKTYIIAIAKNLWLKRLKHMQMQTSYEPTLDSMLHELDHNIEQEKSYWEKLQDFFTKITNHCHDLLSKIFFQRKTIEQIQDEYGYTNKHNAQNQQHKCIEQVRKVKEKEERAKKV